MEKCLFWVLLVCYLKFLHFDNGPRLNIYQLLYCLDLKTKYLI
jgi:hypothetical protein